MNNENGNDLRMRKAEVYFRGTMDEFCEWMRDQINNYDDRVRGVFIFDEEVDL